MKILRAKAEHIIYAKDISQCIDESAKTRGTGLLEELLSTSLEKFKMAMLSLQLKIIYLQDSVTLRYGVMENM